MFLSDNPQPVDTGGLLRTSGDVSMLKGEYKGQDPFAPHERRCFSVPRHISGPGEVCSARAEMFPGFFFKRKKPDGLLRTSGDVSSWKL